MCKWGANVDMEVIIPAGCSCTGKAHKKIVGIDACIAPIIAALNNAGIVTTGCCCGHGKNAGYISLADGRMLEITTLPEGSGCCYELIPG